MFAFFAWQFKNNWASKDILGFLFIHTGDTNSYYLPIESFCKGGGYSSACRMPGLLPLYAPLYWIFGAINGKVAIIMLQFLLSTISIYALACTAKILFKTIQAFYICFVLYSLSSFVTIWDHYGTSDSFSTSFLIFALYFFIAYSHKKNPKVLLLAGIFMTWSCFFRPVNYLFYIGLTGIFSYNLRFNFKALLKTNLLFVMPSIFALTFWTINNYHKHNKFIPLQDTFEACYPTALSKEHLAIRKIIQSMGGDYQEWSKGSKAEWFYNSGGTPPFKSNDFTNEYTFDSLVILKYQLLAFKRYAINNPCRKLISETIIEKANRYSESYIKERPFRYYVTNSLTLIKKFVIWTRLDDLPYPKLSEMKIYHKVTKGGYLVLLNIVNILGLVGIFYNLRRKDYIGLLVIIYIIVIGGILRFLEQRYLVPVYPLLIMYATIPINRLYQRLRGAKVTPLKRH